MKYLQKGNFESVISEPKLNIVIFGLRSSNRSQVVKNIILPLETESIGVYFVNYDSEKSIGIEYNIRALPTIILFRNGEVVARLDAPTDDEIKNGLGSTI